MDDKTILILGGGRGGLTAAHHLRDLLQDEHRIVVLERGDTFSLGFSNLSLMTGERESTRQIQRDMAKLRNPGIEWIQAEVQRIDAEAKSIDTDAGTFSGDYLVVALGAQLAPEAMPGFNESALNLYEPAGAVAIHEALGQFTGGRIVVLVAGAPFRCPAAPYEAAMLVEAWTRENDIRDKVKIDLYTPESIPMAVAGPEVGQALCAMMDERDVGNHFGQQVTAIETNTLRFDDGDATFDLLIGIPPHRAPTVLAQAGLIDATGYVPVHPQTLELLSDAEALEVRHRGVYAIGDVAAIRLANSMLLPKAGVFAEREGLAVAAAIAADINGEPATAGYDGNGFCYVDVGDGLAAFGSGDFYAAPQPSVSLENPSTEARRAKHELEELLDIWFDS